MPIINLDDSEAISENLIGRTEVKAGLGDVVGARVVPFKLTSAVLEAVQLPFVYGLDFLP